MMRSKVLQSQTLIHIQQDKRFTFQNTDIRCIVHQISMMNIFPPIIVCPILRPQIGYRTKMHLWDFLCSNSSFSSLIMPSRGVSPLKVARNKRIISGVLYIRVLISFLQQYSIICCSNNHSSRIHHLFHFHYFLNFHSVVFSPHPRDE